MVSRAYCFTLNNYTDDDVAQLTALINPVRYVCWGYEIAPSGTPHLQGYAEFTKTMRITGIKKLGGPFEKMHLTVRRGTRDQAKDYCAKGTQPKQEWDEFAKLGDGKLGPNYGIGVNFVEHGDWNAGGAGARNDLGKTRNIALTGGLREVTLTGNAQQIKVAEKFLTYHEEPRDWLTEVSWFWGPSGSGKSRTARENLKDNDVYVKNDNTKWWDGYDGHEAVIIDDFRDSWWSLTEMLSLLDRYEKRVEVKGGWRQCKPRKIIITSIHPPESMYVRADEDAKQLIRRLSFVTKFCNEVGGVILMPPEPITNGVEENDNLLTLEEEYEILEMSCEELKGLLAIADEECRYDDLERGSNLLNENIKRMNEIKETIKFLETL